MTYSMNVGDCCGRVLCDDFPCDHCPIPAGRAGPPESRVTLRAGPFDGESRMVRDDHGFVRIPILCPDAMPEDAAEFADYRRSADEGIFDYIRKANNEFPTGS